VPCIAARGAFPVVWITIVTGWGVAVKVISDGFELQLMPTADASLTVGVVPLSVVTVVHWNVTRFRLKRGRPEHDGYGRGLTREYGR